MLVWNVPFRMKKLISEAGLLLYIKNRSKPDFIGVTFIMIKIPTRRFVASSLFQVKVGSDTVVKKTKNFFPQQKYRHKYQNINR